MHVQEEGGLSVGLCGFLWVLFCRNPSYRHHGPSEPTCSTSPAVYLAALCAHSVQAAPANCTGASV